MKRTMLLLILLISIPVLLWAEDFDLNPSQQEFSLLLSSGLVKAEESTVKYVIWTEDVVEIKKIEKILAKTNINWKKEILRDFAQRKAVKYSAEQTVEKEGEQSALLFYTHVSNLVKNANTKMYFQQEVRVAIDAETYMNGQQVHILQEVDLDTMTAISGYRPKLPGTIQAGQDKINVQLMTKDDKKSGIQKTVLALPALLEEF